MKKLNRLVIGFTLTFLPACGGRAIDLDQGPNLGASGGAAAAGELVNLSDSIDRLDADETRVFWSTRTGSAWSCEYDACGATKVTYGAVSSDLTLGKDDVYFVRRMPNADLGPVVECPKSGCTGTPKVVSVDYSPTRIGNLGNAVDDAYFYWSSELDIYRCPLGNCGEVPEVVAKYETTNSTLILEGDDVFWTVFADPDDINGDSVIRSAPKDGSRPPRTIATGVGPFGAINFAVDGTNVYWLDAWSRVQACARTGCAGQSPVTLVATPGAKEHLLVDATRLYWQETTDITGNWTRGQGAWVDHISIRSCPIAGCAPGIDPEILTPSKVGMFAMDSKYLYWTEPELRGDPPFPGDSKQIFRRAKP